MSLNWRLAGVIVLVAAFVAAFAVFLHFVPFEAGSYLFWTGAVLSLGGLAIAFRKRRTGVLTLATGIASAAIGSFWPFALEKTAEQHIIDQFLPQWHFREIHSERFQASPDRVYRALRATTFGDLVVYRTLMGARQWAMGKPMNLAADNRPILAAMSAPNSNFVLLAEDPGREIVLGTPMNFAGGNPLRVSPEELKQFSQPGWVIVVFNIRLQDEGGGWTRALTETRIRGTDAAAANSFARYWRVVYPGSAIIRRMWLRAVETRLPQV